MVLTSNSEKNLPDAFLRRCAYYHIPFPNEDRLINIVRANVELQPAFTERMLEAAIEHFMALRGDNLKKPPATAELLSWVHILQKHHIDVRKSIEGEETEIRKKLHQSYSLLLKNKEDRETILGR